MLGEFMRQPVFKCCPRATYASLACEALLCLTLLACGGEQKAASPAAASAAESAAGGETASAAPASAPPAQEGAAGDPNEFVVHTSETAKGAAPTTASKIKPSRSEAALKFIVLDKDKGPLVGIVISLTAPDGKKYFTEETNGEGYTEILVPVGQKYDLVYLTLGREDIAANVKVTDEPHQSIKLTLRYKRERPTPTAPEPRFVLDGVTFASGKAVIDPQSYPRLDSVVEYMVYKKSARIEISGHTDNQGNPKANKALSEKRAQACRDYLIQKGIDGSRIEAHGFGDERPIAPNDSEDGRRQNRRIEATEL
jgi:outer membrane protein OmpA-like peptidoglycan-associated protein